MVRQLFSYSGRVTQPLLRLKACQNVSNSTKAFSTGAAAFKMAGGDDSLWKNASSIYEFEVTDIEGNTVKLDKYTGKVCLIVNVASKWGLTQVNYTQLQALHSRYAEKGLAILGFPCNQFGGQEPGTDQEIKKFAVGNFGVQFDMFSKIKVNGADAAPLYKYLKSVQGSFMGDFIKWNFAKFLVDKNGVPVRRYAPNVAPNDIEKDIKDLL